MVLLRGSTKDNMLRSDGCGTETKAACVLLYTR